MFVPSLFRLHPSSGVGNEKVISRYMHWGAQPHWPSIILGCVSSQQLTAPAGVHQDNYKSGEEAAKNAIKRLRDPWSQLGCNGKPSV